jgi:hypothetical protein
MIKKKLTLGLDIDENKIQLTINTKFRIVSTSPFLALPKST